MAAPVFEHYGAGVSFFPVGYDFGLEGSLPLLEEFGVDAMTATPFDEEALPRWDADALLDAAAGALSDASKSPGQQSHIARAGAGDGTDGSASLSPSAASNQILTPTSTLLESPDVTPLEDPELDANISTSPDSDHGPVEDYVYVRRRDAQPRTALPSMSGTYSTRASPGPLPPATHPPSEHFRAASPSLPQAPTRDLRDPPWPSFASSSSGTMDDFNNDFSYSGVPDQDFHLFSDLTSNAGGGFDQSLNTLPFRTNAPQAAYQDFTSQSQQHVAFRANTTAAPDYSHHAYAPPVGANSTFTSPYQQQYGTGFNFPFYSTAQLAPGNVQHQGLLSPNVTRVPPPIGVSTSPPTGAPTRQTVAASRHAHPQARVKVRVTPAENNPSPTNSQRSANSFDGMNVQQTTLGGYYPAIVAADPSRPQASASRPTQQEHKVQKGGRRRNTHLPETSRQRSHQMRKIGACWRCAMQRDSCDHGDPCSRCAMQSQKGHAYYFGCDRSKLPDFVGDFLPHYFLYDHQKKSIEAVVSREVVSWHTDNCIDVYLSSGYGPPLRWKLYEFSPRSDDLLYQLQYFQDAQSGKSYTKKKYAPPYGLLGLDSSDDVRLEQYLEDLLQPRHLRELGEGCYAEENLVDPDKFQCHVLDLLCQLYIQTQDEALKTLLRDILRMMVITYIMGHTLTILEDTLYPVIQNIRHSRRPFAYEEQTSPRLANRQLKYFFQGMRSSIYEKILKWQQQTLHTAGKKEQTWLHTFCAMLGFAMVLEEIQRTIMCMADAKMNRNEATLEQATDEAYNACERIDERFRLLIGLFQCKYRDKKWGEKGSFGPSTPELKDPVGNEFLRILRELVDRRVDHLRRRENVPFSLDNQCLYTTRLTAKFLLPFLNLANVS